LLLGAQPIRMDYDNHLDSLFLRWHFSTMIGTFEIE
jgi:hypothetical protein